MSDRNAKYRSLPSVDALAAAVVAPQLSHLERTWIAREAVAVARTRLDDGAEAGAFDIAEEMVAVALARRIGPVVNATGVILHTNLGRAPLSAAASDAAARVSSGYSNTEFDVRTGERGMRGARTRTLLQLLTGAEDALVVNNNAAAVLLALTALASGRSVPVSRSELVEIGGSYRLPEVMNASGAKLVEVGTTNKTRLGDYDTSLQIHDCSMVLKVHLANYQITGFTATPLLSELIDLCRSREIPFVYDVGSGLLDSSTPWLPDRPSWLKDEPGVRQALEAGTDLVLFSGDKLLGGPQAGILVGKASLVSALRAHPITRALRVDASTEAALAATLDSYAAGFAAREIPFWRMATEPFETLDRRSRSAFDGLDVTFESGWSVVGAGSAPGSRIDTPAVRIQGRQEIYAPLLAAQPPIVARRESGDLLIDLRTVNPEHDRHLGDTVRACL